MKRISFVGNCTGELKGRKTYSKIPFLVRFARPLKMFSYALDVFDTDYPINTLELPG